MPFPVHWIEIALVGYIIWLVRDVKVDGIPRVILANNPFSGFHTETPHYIVFFAIQPKAYHTVPPSHHIPAAGFYGDDSHEG